MKIEMSERELNTISNNIIKQVARFVKSYIDDSDESEFEEDIFLVEPNHLIESILKIDVNLKAIIQPPNK
jgi:hypothetical protein